MPSIIYDFPFCLSRGGGFRHEISPQITDFFTSALIFASSEAVNSFNAKDHFVREFDLHNRQFYVLKLGFVIASSI
jgi:hypothetical protein